MEREEIIRLIKEEKKIAVVLKNGSRYSGYLRSISESGTIQMKDTKNLIEPFDIRFNINEISELIIGGAK